MTSLQFGKFVGPALLGCHRLAPVEQAFGLQGFQNRLLFLKIRC